MAASLTQFLIAAVIIVLGGIGLSRSAEAISRLTGLGHLLGGALLIATASSLPDLVTGISAAREGWADLAVGDLIGAALMNLLVLAFLDLLHWTPGDHALTIGGGSRAFRSHEHQPVGDYWGCLVASGAS